MLLAVLFREKNSDKLKGTELPSQIKVRAGCLGTCYLLWLFCFPLQKPTFISNLNSYPNQLIAGKAIAAQQGRKEDKAGSLTL